ncbi:hypothetical protein SAMN05443579_11084 [Variovorax sp. PDC80]|nr:hypothetical protein SAMN05443579_11084 [Variovorax sp. PDC80]
MASLVNLFLVSTWSKEIPISDQFAEEPKEEDDDLIVGVCGVLVDFCDSGDMKLAYEGYCWRLDHRRSALLAPGQRKRI